MHSSVLAWRIPIFQRACQVALVVKNLPANAGDVREVSLIPRSGRAPGGGHGRNLAWRILWTEDLGRLWSTGS